MKQSKLKEIFSLFFKLGLTSFGGPVAHIALMEKEVVSKREWMTHAHFLDLIGATNLIPGPNSTEMAMHCGYHRAGFSGLWVAGVAFIFPAVFITTLLALFYQKFGQLPAIAPMMMGIKPVVVVIIADAVFKFGKKALKNWALGILGGCVFMGSLFGFNDIALLLIAGVIGILLFKLSSKSEKIFSVDFLSLFWVFFKVGAALFGSGYVLFAYLNTELVHHLSWLTQPQLMDAIAMGQFTPGPVLSSAIFIGFQIGGIWGAVVATFGIFLPSFLLVQFLNPFVPKLRQSKTASHFIDAVNVASVALMGAVLIQLCKSSLIDWPSISIAALAIWSACIDSKS